MLVDQVVDYCIPRSRINEASEHFVRTNSTEKILQLQREAKDLFTKIKTTGEGGELLLYAFLEIALGLPQILCKMSLKTNAQVHYHGVDGVHALPSRVCELRTTTLCFCVWLRPNQHVPIPERR